MPQRPFTMLGRQDITFIGVSADHTGVTGSNTENDAVDQTQSTRMCMGSHTNLYLSYCLTLNGGKGKSMERSLSIIKPDGVSKRLVGEVIRIFEDVGFRIAAMKMKKLSREEAQGFYYVHRERPFFGELVEFMISGPVVLMVLEGEDVIMRNREIMGATDPAEAAEGTIRKRWADSKQNNIVHGSDGPESAMFEINYFFSGIEIF